MKEITFFSLIILFLSSCGTKGQTDKKRETIDKFISAVKTYDTLQLFELVDTSEYFDVEDKENFLYQINYMLARFKECGKALSDSSIKISHRDIPFTDYTYLFCRGRNNEIVDGSFDVQFTFADFDKVAKIHFFNVRKYNQNTKPTIPLSP